jgi:chemotaxis protein CheX
VSRKKPLRTGAVRKRQPACLQLGARLSIAEAADLHRTLLARLDKGAPVILDGAQVEEIDTAMLQLLASLWRTSAARGISCTWQGASAALRETATLVGMAEVLNFPADERM